jgi:hypothetical protein
MTKKEIENYARIARLGCILCRQHGIRTDDSPTEIHHIRRFGNTRALSPCIALCAWHHRLGDTAVHTLGKKAFSRYWGYSEEDLLAKQEELLNE